MSNNVRLKQLINDLVFFSPQEKEFYISKLSNLEDEKIAIMEDRLKVLAHDYLSAIERASAEWKFFFQTTINELEKNESGDNGKN